MTGATKDMGVRVASADRAVKWSDTTQAMPSKGAPAQAIATPGMWEYLCKSEDEEGRTCGMTIVGLCATGDTVKNEGIRWKRGRYITFSEHWHGEGAVGIMSLSYGTELGLTLIDGFDWDISAHDLVTRRHGVPTMLGDADAVYADPGCLRRSDLVCAGSPCQDSSWAPHYGRDTEPDADAPRNRHYPGQVAPITQSADGAVLEYPSDVRKVRSLDPHSPNFGRARGWLHVDVLKNFERAGWSTWEYDLNSNMHGSAGARRRLYTLGFSADAVAAAARAGVHRPGEIPPIPFRSRRAMRDVLVDDEIIDKHHPHLYTGHRLTVPTLRGDGGDQRQVTRINTGASDTEPVGDVRLPAMAMKCFGGTPLIMLEDGRVRRTLLGEFAAIGSVPWSVGHGMSCEPTQAETRTAKTLMGNTWDATLTRKVMTVAAEFIQHLVNERADQEADIQRVAARFATLWARVVLPARRAWRVWIQQCRRCRNAAIEWHRMGRKIAVLQMRRIGWMGEADTAIGLWRALTAGGEQVVKMREQTFGKSAGSSRTGSVFLSDALDEEMASGYLRFTECVAVTKGMMPDIRGSVTQRRWGTTLVLPSEVTSEELWQRPLPALRVPPTSTMPPPPHAPTEEEQAAFNARFRTEQSVFTEDGWSKLKAWERAMEKDAEGCRKHGTEGPDAYRVRLKCGQPPGELRLTQRHLQPEARGLPIVFDEESGAPSIAVPVPIADRDDVVILCSKIKAWMIARGWRDRFMLWVMDWGWVDLTNTRPWVMSFSPNMSAAYDRFHKVCTAQELEIRRKWSFRHTRLPFAGAIHIVPTNAVDKSDGSARLLGNASHPPKGTYLDVIDEIMVMPNAHTDWSMLPRFEWASIDRFGEAVAILCAITLHVRGWDRVEETLLCRLIVVGSRDDLEKWFRQIPQFSGDWCKQVYHWDGCYITDRHVQMGRGSSADGAQRLSIVCGEIVFEKVESVLTRKLEAGTATGEEPWCTLARVTEMRRRVTGQSETGLWALDLMQDDLGYVAITTEVGSVVRNNIEGVLKEYGVAVSMSKRAEDEAAIDGPQPNVRMLYIGADYYMSDLAKPGFRGQDKSIEKFEEVVKEMISYKAGKLVPLLLLQRAIGMGLFHGRFFARSRRYLNSGIRCLRGRRGSRRVVSRAWLRDVMAVWRRAEARVPFPMVQPANWWHPGLLGCNSDASRPSSEHDISRGFGGNVLHAYFVGQWTRREVDALDISTLELIAVAFLVVVAALSGALKPRMVVRCDNEAACRVINDHRADSAAMGEALMHLEAVQCHYGVEILAHHIAGVDNVIADELSRDREQEALERLRALTGTEPVKYEIPHQWRDTSNILSLVRS